MNSYMAGRILAISWVQVTMYLFPLTETDQVCRYKHTQSNYIPRHPDLLLLFFFLGLYLQHMEVPRVGVESELQLPTYPSATATWDLSLICDLHHSSRQSWIFNPLSEAKDWTLNLMVPCRIRFHCSMMGTPGVYNFFFLSSHLSLGLWAASRYWLL